jgi:hypothetical protein
MSCCGNKRKQWMQNQSHEERERQSLAVAASQSPATPPMRSHTSLFEYVGNGSLMVRGASSGQSYHFTHVGMQLEVMPEDSFGLMAERELRVVTMPSKNQSTPMQVVELAKF